MSAPVLDPISLSPCEWGPSAHCVHGRHDRCPGTPITVPDGYLITGAETVSYGSHVWACPCPCGHRVSAP